MVMRGSSVQHAEYQRLVGEYRDRLAQCLASLEELSVAERRMRELAVALTDDVERFEASPEIANSLSQLTVRNNVMANLAIADLSAREFEVFALIGEGLATHEVAKQLNLATSTVETYRERLKSKLKLNSGAALTRHAILWAASRHEAMARN
jgi:DNA-binding NarL/FixJ family response regulator